MRRRSRTAKLWNGAACARRFISSGSAIRPKATACAAGVRLDGATPASCARLLRPPRQVVEHRPVRELRADHEAALAAVLERMHRERELVAGLQRVLRPTVAR